MITVYAIDLSNILLLSIAIEDRRQLNKSSQINVTRLWNFMNLSERKYEKYTECK